MKRCQRCQKELDFEFKVQRSSLCPYCQAELKICLNCKFYSPGSHWDCLETISEPVREKDKANFCEYFVFKENESNHDFNKDRLAGRKKFENLFES